MSTTEASVDAGASIADRDKMRALACDQWGEPSTISFNGGDRVASHARSYSGSVTFCRTMS
jgi:hypothetical protein